MSAKMLQVGKGYKYRSGRADFDFGAWHPQPVRKLVHSLRQPGNRPDFTHVRVLEHPHALSDLEGQVRLLWSSGFRRLAGTDRYDNLRSRLARIVRGGHRQNNLAPVMGGQQV